MMNRMSVFRGRPDTLRPLAGLSLLASVALAFFAGCDDGPSSSADGDTPREPRPDEIVLTFTYGSEKEKWIDAVTEEFHRTDPKTSGGKLIRIEAIPMGSGECVIHPRANRGDRPRTRGRPFPARPREPRGNATSPLSADRGLREPHPLPRRNPQRP